MLLIAFCCGGTCRLINDVIAAAFAGVFQRDRMD
jgi:hypothetical protein